MKDARRKPRSRSHLAISCFVIIGGILFLGILISPLRWRWYLRCSFALLGAILIGGSVFAAEKKA
jgi:hypothetical protein